MANPKQQNEIDDLNASSNVKRIDDLEAFRKEFEGEKLYEKIAVAIEKSKTVEGEIKKVVWVTIREKIVWIILGGLGVILIDLLLRAIPRLISKIG